MPILVSAGKINVYNVNYPQLPIDWDNCVLKSEGYGQGKHGRK